MVEKDSWGYENSSKVFRKLKKNTFKFMQPQKNDHFCIWNLAIFAIFCKNRYLMHSLTRLKISKMLKVNIFWIWQKILVLSFHLQFLPYCYLISDRFYDILNFGHFQKKNVFFCIFFQKNQNCRTLRAKLARLQCRASKQKYIKNFCQNQENFFSLF